MKKYYIELTGKLAGRLVNPLELKLPSCRYGSNRRKTTVLLSEKILKVTTLGCTIPNRLEVVGKRTVNPRKTTAVLFEKH